MSINDSTIAPAFQRRSSSGRWSFAWGFFLALQLIGDTAGQGALAVNPLTRVRFTPIWQQIVNQSFRVRKVEIIGAGNLSTKRLGKVCGIQPDSILNVDSLRRCKERIINAYLQAGYIKAAVDVQVVHPEAGPATRQGMVDVAITISEGAKYQIAAIEFRGNENTRHRIAQRATGLQVGDVYDPSQVTRWIRGLNRLGRFDTVKLKDVEVVIDDDDHSVLLRFHVKEK